MTTYIHKHDKSEVRTYGELLRQFHKLRREDDEFYREYLSHEVERWIDHHYITLQDDYPLQELEVSDIDIKSLLIKVKDFILKDGLSDLNAEILNEITNALSKL